MSFIRNNRLVSVGIALLIISLILAAYHIFKPVPTNTNFITDEYSFTYPRAYATEEYAPGVMSIGYNTENGLNAVVDVNTYMSDPQSALPKNFDAFVRQQAEAFCGSDNSIEAITCTQKDIAPYTSPKGQIGQKMDLTLVRKNLKTGTTTSSTYGPFYVFDTTSTAPREDGIPFRYSGVFIYPSFTAVLASTTKPELLTQVIDTFVLPKKK